ncbi:DUF5000 domain-containing lipoprotein [Sphingobacterium chuzhouense]|uniref:DUF5126 domain-containing protein n=1 Tax=Sphingobacterium chuzhouense TaxID=1742264 RepID=A0ABR7XVL1_9SPHI|nr:DUF5000 domain-containing lipoprotein [Sphingobacterium chuzhouense]MBD1423095.1 DUF5126 domain-containing protein [Sphingobacterium chuzhouense]
MMIQIKIMHYAVLLLVFGVWSCGEDTFQGLDSSGEPPATLRSAELERVPGGIRISYSLPPEGDLLYIEAEVEMRNGNVKKIRSSYYKKNLLLEGFGDTSEYPIKLYSVGRNLKRSQPLEIIGRPGTPAIWDVFESIDMTEDFGGFRLSYQNEYQNHVSIMIFRKDENEAWAPTQNFYTSQALGEFTLRGLAAEPTVFGVAVKDRWGNQTEIMTKELTPLYEERIPPSGFRQMFATLPTEAPGWVSGSVMSNLWSGVFVGTTNSQAWYRTNETAGIPHHFTFDMGKTAQLSRFVYWQRGAFDREDLLYSGGSAKRFEVWGSTDPDPAGSFDGWTLLTTCDMVKPSGLPAGSVSTEDVTAAQAGHEYSFPLDVPLTRFIRIRILETWGKTSYMWMSELQFYGQIN